MNKRVKGDPKFRQYITKGFNTKLSWEAVIILSFMLLFCMLVANQFGEQNGYKRGFEAGAEDMGEYCIEELDMFKEDVLLAVENATNQAYLKGYKEGISSIMDFLEGPKVVTQTESTITWSSYIEPVVEEA